MRRRSRLAALPVHRHALPQIAVDAGLVALAYFLAYRLRFDANVPDDYQQLFERTLSFVVIGSIAIFTAFGLYRHWMRYSSQREYLRIVQAVIASVLALVAYAAIVKPKLVFVGYPRGFVPVPLPAKRWLMATRPLPSTSTASLRPGLATSSSRPTASRRC